MGNIANVGHGKRGSKLQSKAGHTHETQTKGHKIGLGFAEGNWSPKGRSYHAEQKEHWGSMANGGKTKMPDKRPPVGAIEGSNRGSKLVHNDGIQGHKSNNFKSPIGTGMSHKGSHGGAEHHKGANVGGAAHAFRSPMSDGAHSFGHSGGQRKGPLRTSGHSGAHQVGKR